jgi:hypothetical protein
MSLLNSLDVGTSAPSAPVSDVRACVVEAVRVRQCVWACACVMFARCSVCVRVTL